MTAPRTGSRYELQLDRAGVQESKVERDYYAIHAADIEDVPEEDDLVGYVHSYEVGTTVDGPGLRFVAFLTGCLLRCQYCHNPDTWHKRNGHPVTVSRAMTQIAKYAKVLKISKGGITLSGGEPMVQRPFMARIFRRCKELGLHTCLDTAGRLGEQMTDAGIMDVDLHLLDIKSGDPEIYKKVTHQPLQPTLDYARRLSDMGRPMWIRYVLVPGSHRRLRQRREGGRVRRRAEERRAGRDPALPSAGQRQVGPARPRLPAREGRARRLPS